MQTLIGVLCLPAVLLTARQKALSLPSSTKRCGLLRRPILHSNSFDFCFCVDIVVFAAWHFIIVISCSSIHKKGGAHSFMHVIFHERAHETHAPVTTEPNAACNLHTLFKSNPFARDHLTSIRFLGRRSPFYKTHNTNIHSQTLGNIQNSSNQHTDEMTIGRTYKLPSINHVRVKIADFNEMLSGCCF